MTGTCRHPKNQVLVTRSEAAGRSMASVMQWNYFRCEVCGREWRRLEDYALPVGQRVSEVWGGATFGAASVGSGPPSGPRTLRDVIGVVRNEWRLDYVPKWAKRSPRKRVPSMAMRLLAWPGPAALRWGLLFVAIGFMMAMTGGGIFGFSLDQSPQDLPIAGVLFVAGIVVGALGAYMWTAYRMRHWVGVPTAGDQADLASRPPSVANVPLKTTAAAPLEQKVRRLLIVCIVLSALYAILGGAVVLTGLTSHPRQIALSSIIAGFNVVTCLTLVVVRRLRAD